MEGKVIAITGAASGIGLATARLLAARGASLSLADVQSGALEEAVKSIQEATPDTKLHSRALDVTDSKSVNEWHDAIIEHYGHLDGAANIAGVIGEIGPKIMDIKDEAWERTLGINLKGVFFCLRAQLQRIENEASIVNAASIAAFNACPSLAAYGASKAGVVSLTKTAAKEVGHKGIRVNCIAPGPIQTPMTNSEGNPLSKEQYLKRVPLLERFGQPEEIAKLIAFLLSEESSYTTGAVYTSDGGYAA
ncbi:MAG: hypothetical protein Q9191_001406 [Dirinaria sp. TL-2023a]